MRIIIAGGHGQIALRLAHLLSSRGDEVVGIIRKSEHAQDIVTAGAEPLVCDLESADVADVVRILKSADAAVFAAGAGPGSGIARKETVDHAAAVLFADAAEGADIAAIPRHLVHGCRPRAAGGHRARVRGTTFVQNPPRDGAPRPVPRQLDSTIAPTRPARQQRSRAPAG